MCAIAGFFGAPPPDAGAALADVLASLRHRGPDDTGQYVDAVSQIALGHNRLSIIDLGAGGHQPMIDPDTGDVLVFNGEIYNYRDIRQTLIAEGGVFRTRSDSEVLLKAFGKWGADCLKRLRGMYAFALWRPCEETLYIARDPLGVKPLYYRTDSAGGLFFASEIKAFLALRDFSARVDRNALGQFLEFGYCFEEDRTIFQDVRKLGPGEMISCRRGAAPTIVRYFAPRIETRPARDREGLADELFETLDKVVEEQLVADVPVGLLLSGGLDSSVIAALAARKTSVRTLTMAFDGSSVDERLEARRVAQYVGAQNEEIVIASEELGANVGAVASTFDDIFADWGALSTRLLYAKARECGVKVVLTGEGADEIFGGYPLFRAAASRAPTEIWLFQLYRAYAGRRYGNFFGAFRRIMRDYLRETGGERFDALRLFETRNQLPNNYVMKVDKASMSVGVEARVPYLDQRVVELAFQIPAQYLQTLGGEKQLLRDMAERRGLLPRASAQRPKYGASVASSWMDEHPAFRAYARDIVLAGGGWTDALGLTSAMQDYFLRDRYGYAAPRAISIFRNLAWRLLLLELWSKSMGVSVDPR